MPLPALAAAGIASAGAGLIGNIIGGVLGKSSQSTANKTNLAIARETNANNYKIAQEANALTHQMMLEQQKYASPLEQRRMLQEAGYNPALYGDSKAMPGGSPVATTGSPQIAPSVMPEDAFASRIGSMSADLSNLVVATSEARKNNAEAQQVEIQNSFESERLTKALEAMGLTNEAQYMRNQFIYSSEQKNLELLASQIGWNEQQIKNAQIAYEIEKYKHDKLQPEEYNKLVAEVAKLNEETLTEQSLQSYYKTMEDVGIKQADAQSLLAAVAKFKAPHEVALMDSEKSYYAEMGARTHEEMEQLKHYGPRLKNAEFLNILQQTVNGKVNAYEGWQRAKMIIKDLKYADFDRMSKHYWLYPLFFPTKEVNPTTEKDFKSYVDR